MNATLITVGTCFLASLVAGCDTPLGTSFGSSNAGTGGRSSVVPDGGSGGPADAGADRRDGCGSTTLPANCSRSVTAPACTLSVNGITRQFFLALPTDYSPTTPYPLVFAWHPRGNVAQNLEPGFDGVRPGFPNAIYVAPQGLDVGDGSGNDYGWPNTNGRDVDFARAMITWLEANYCIDTSRIFSTGMSYGGVMSNTLGCQMPDVFRALGVLSGSLIYDHPTCSTHPIAAWFTHGDADALEPIAGDWSARNLFIADNGCSPTETTTVTLTDSSAVTDAGTPVITVCTIYNQCTAGNYPVVWCPVPGGGHTIPSWAGSEIAEFFQQF